MKLPIGALILLLALSAAGRGEAVHPEVLIGPAPEWVDPVALPEFEAEARADATEGVRHLLVDEQLDGATGDYFGHFARGFVTESGVQDSSRLSIAAEPSYEKIVLHQLDLIRGGERTSLLGRIEPRFLQREQSLDMDLYDGRVSVVWEIPDVRVGDVLEYAFSIRGRNPVLGDRLAGMHSTRWAVPVDLFQLRLSWPEEQPLEVLGRGDGLRHEQERGEGRMIHTWSRHDVPRILYEDNLPGWFATEDWVQYSENDTWGDVVDWALTHYELPETLPPSLEERIQQWSKLPPMQRVAAALTYTQDEVRYVSLSTGVHSYRPYSVEQVIERGFGDCKDKARMLCAILRRLGIDAWPALVNTGARQRIGEWLPSVIAFDHVVVLAEVDGEAVWLDPTVQFQGGPLRQRFFPDYGWALVVREGEEALTPVPGSGFDASHIRLEERYDIPGYDEPVTLDIEAVYEGGEGDWMRSYLASTSSEQIAKNYHDYILRLHPAAEPKRRPKFSDDRARNQISAVEAYAIEELWQPDEENPDMLRFEVFPFQISGLLQPPDVRRREMPLAVAYPKRIEERFVLKLPEPGEFEREDVVVRDPAFRFHYEAIPKGRTLLVRYRYESLKDHVRPDGLERYLENVDKARATLGYAVEIPKALREGTPTVTPTKKEPFLFAVWLPILFFLVVLAGMVGLVPAVLALILPRREPIPPPLSPLVGIRGWLWPLYASLLLGLLWLPVDAGIAIAMAAWPGDIETGEVSVRAMAGLGGLAVVIAGSAFFWPVQVAICINFFLRRRTVPWMARLYFLLVLVAVAVELGAQFALAVTVPWAWSPWLLAVRATTAVAALAWWLYLRNSRRVRLTFTG